MYSEKSRGINMKPGEYLLGDGEITANAGRKTATVRVSNTGDRPVQVGSHFHFFEVNRALRFDRAAAFNMRLDIPAGTAVRFEPGEEKPVTLVEIGTTYENLQNTVAQEPQHIIIDRCYMHPNADASTIRRAVALHAAYVDVTNSYIEDIHEGSDSNAIAGWNGTGPYNILNNHLEGAGENILFGGATNYMPTVASNVACSPTSNGATNRISSPVHRLSRPGSSMPIKRETWATSRAP